MNDKKDFGQKLKNCRKNANLTQKELANIIGVSAQVISNWERGYTTGVDTDVLSLLSEVLNCSTDYLIGRNEIPIKIDSIRHTTRIPIIGVIKAGEPIFAIENIEGYEYVDIEETKGGEFFYLRVTGDSMVNARILDGDLVYVKKQSDVDSGDIAVVLINGYEATLKRVLKTDDSVILHPENPKYKPKVFSKNEIESGYLKIIGKVIHVKFKI